MHVNPILVVDDNAQIVDILSQYIKKEGWPMLAAKTGGELRLVTVDGELPTGAQVG